MSLIPPKLEHYIRFFIFINKYWDADLVDKEGDDLEDEHEERMAGDFNHSPEELVEDLKNMGPTYIKLGQLLSTRPDLLPPSFIHALSSLQDDVEAFAYREVAEIFKAQIGQRISKAFKYFDSKPLASASIGQVHIAVLHSGKKVAVKIQRPGVRKRIMEDLEVLVNLAKQAEYYNENARKFSIYELVEELQYILLQELDYQREAQNLRTLNENLKEFHHLYVPLPISDFCSDRVLTMEFVDGQKVTSLSPLALMDLPVNALVDDFVKGYLKQIIIDGFAHADPHPGNININSKGQLAIMDLGMVAKFSYSIQEVILKLMMALGNYDGDKTGNILLEMSSYDDKKAHVDQFKKRVVRKIQQSENTKAKDLQTGRTLLEMNKFAALNGIVLPVELSILGKILLNMDQIVAFLAPNYDLHQTVKNYVEELMQQRMVHQMQSGHFLQSVLELKELAEKLPYRLNKITENLADNTFRIKVDAIDETRFAIAFQKVANRITIGLIIAALILGAALMMRIPTSWTLGGYPGFAILLFLFAASIGLYLVYLILFKDESDSRNE
ncbi:AarF/UbiB family protein [Flavobacterium sp. JP2137]|uniref:ABC1 kinase family protein n=1 Tax=Flavobacterium sp. JP2137 TaxID=3414510 RepID=UPI003D300B9C